MRRTALVVGATGGIGGEVARGLVQRGWKVRGLSRQARQGELEWVKGDAMVPSEVIAAAQGAELVVHAANPAGYRDWDKLALPMLESSIQAARSAGARILFPGTLYNFGPDAFPVLHESSVQNPNSRKGAIRVAMEQRLKDSGVPTLVVRAGDFFGPRSGNSWFSQLVVKPGQPLRAVTYPGDPEVSHAWAYLPDLAEAMLRLIERTEAGGFEVFHFRGHWFARGGELAHAVRSAAGNERLPIRSFPWWGVRLASPFVPLFRELTELRWLWFTPQELDNRKLVSVLGEEPHTPLDQALRATLDGLGCW
jgi:nucleoside-diphosphate-sugar epimerase